MAFLVLIFLNRAATAAFPVFIPVNSYIKLVGSIISAAHQGMRLAGHDGRFIKGNDIAVGRISQRGSVIRRVKHPHGVTIAIGIAGARQLPAGSRCALLHNTVQWRRFKAGYGIRIAGIHYPVALLTAGTVDRMVKGKDTCTCSQCIGFIAAVTSGGHIRQVFGCLASILVIYHRLHHVIPCR